MLSPLLETLRGHPKQGNMPRSLSSPLFLPILAEHRDGNSEISCLSPTP